MSLLVMGMLGLIQTLMVFVTVYWAIRYTNETIAMREEVTKQAELARKQLLVAQRTFRRQEEERIRAMYPFFEFKRGGRVSSRLGHRTYVAVKFIVRVAPVYGVLGISHDMRVRATTDEEHRYFNVGDEGLLEFTGADDGPLPEDEWEFGMEFTTLYNTRHKLTFKAGLTNMDTCVVWSPVYEKTRMDFWLEESGSSEGDASS